MALALLCTALAWTLEVGIPAERGLRCCYHAWQFDVDGTMLTPFNYVFTQTLLATHPEITVIR